MTTLAADARPAASSQFGWLLPSVRPVTLLIACGIVLITAILIAADHAVDELRGQSLRTMYRPNALLAAIGSAITASTA